MTIIHLCLKGKSKPDERSWRRAVLASKAIPASAKIAAFALLLEMKEHGQPKSYDSIGDRCRMTGPAAARGIAALETAGFIRTLTRAA